MKKIHKSFKIWKCNIGILFYLLLALIVSLIYSIVIFSLLFLMWPYLFFIGSIILKKEKFDKWIDIYSDFISGILNDK